MAEWPRGSTRRNRKEPTMNRMHPTPGREPMVRSASTSDRRAHRGPRRRSAWVALGALALGMVLGASPVAALPSPPAAGFGGSSGVSPVNGAIFPDDFHVAMTLDHVAEAYAAQGRYAEAEHFYGRVVAILAPRLGSDHSLVQEVLAKQARARLNLELSGARKG